MECFADHSFLEELLALRAEPWQEAAAIGGEPAAAMNEFCYSNGWPLLIPPLPLPLPLPLPPPPTIPVLSSWESTTDPNFCSLFTECFFSPFGEEVSVSPPQLAELEELTELKTPSFPSQEDLSCIMNCGGLTSLEVPPPPACGVEPGNENGQHGERPVFNMGVCPENQGRPKKLTGQPSKNLMAERRRRKRLNDRLSMLRSVVPKISKMDRTAILGDTIDYMKELLDKINGLQEEEGEEVKKVVGTNSNKPNLMGIFRDVKPNEVLVRNSPKFNVVRGNSETRIEICCAGKPGLLLSTLTTLDGLGLEIQQCVISCFNDFSLHASCSEEMEKGMEMSSEDMKQALFRNAGYGGRCF